MLLPEIERQQEPDKEVVFWADAAFAKPEIFEALEARGLKYAIRIPANVPLRWSQRASSVEKPPGSCIWLRWGGMLSVGLESIMEIPACSHAEIKSGTLMDEVNAYISKRQPAILERASPRIRFCPGRKPNVPGIAGPAEAAEGPLPSAEELFSRASERDRGLLSLPPPRRVRLKGAARYYFLQLVSAAAIAGVCFVQVARRLRTGGSPWSTLEWAALLGWMVFEMHPIAAWRLRGLRRLLMNGNVALGLAIISVDKGALWFHKAMVWYDFRDAAGRVRSGYSVYLPDVKFKDRLWPGSLVAVFYDPRDPSRQIAYPCSPLEIVASRAS